MEGLAAIKAAGELIKFSSKVISYVKDVKNAGKERDRLLNEIEGTKKVLEDLEVKANSEDWKAVMDALNASHGPFEQFRTELQNVEKKLTTSDGTLAKLIWHFTKQDVKKILDTINRIKELFILALQNKHLYVLSSLC